MIDMNKEGNTKSEAESVFTNLDKSAAFSVGSDRSDAVLVSPDNQTSVPSLSLSQPTPGSTIPNYTEHNSNQDKEMDINQDIKINTIAEEGTLTQNSSISGLTGASTTQTNKDLFKRMA